MELDYAINSEVGAYDVDYNFHHWAKSNSMCNPPFESPEMCNLSLFNLMKITTFAPQNQDINQKSCERTQKIHHSQEW